MFHVKHEPWGRAGLDLDPGQARQLERYEELLVDRALPLGMIAESDRLRVRERHVLDALRGAPLLPVPAGSVCDLGSGAGLPGIPVAIARRDAALTLVESRRKRAAFLELAVEALELVNAIVRRARIEDLPAGTFDVCLARAFAPPTVTWFAASRLLRPAGVLLFWAGRGFDPDAEKPPDARMTVSTTSSLADTGPVVIMARQ
jgi:16S rRNA (guanine527-N7)-methyltransferase